MMQARARRTDPETSHEAAASVEAGGQAKSQRRLCMAAVVSSAGQTAAEIARRMELERHVPSRRLPELRDAGLVHNGEPRICRVMRRRSMTWLPGPKPEPGQQELF